MYLTDNQDMLFFLTCLDLSVIVKFEKEQKVMKYLILTNFAKLD